MKLDIKLKSSKVTELVNFLDKKLNSFETMNMILFEDDNYKYDIMIDAKNFCEPNVVFKINALNKKSKSTESKVFYFKREEDMFAVLKIDLLGIDTSLKLDLVDRDKKTAYAIYNVYKALTKDNFNKFYDLFKYNQFNNEEYLAEILALLTVNSSLYTAKATKEQKNFIKNKLSYYGFDFETMNEIEFKSNKSELDELAYNTLFELFMNSKMSDKELIWETDSLYRKFLTNHYLNHIEKGTSSSFLDASHRPSMPVMGCRTRFTR